MARKPSKPSKIPVAPPAKALPGGKKKGLVIVIGVGKKPPKGKL